MFDLKSIFDGEIINLDKEIIDGGAIFETKQRLLIIRELLKNQN